MPLLLLALSILPGCTGTPADPPAPTGAPHATPAAPAGLTRVRVALDWFPEPEFGGYYDALASGAYARAGLAVELVPGGPGTPVLEMLAAERTEVAVSGADNLLVRRGKGLQAVALLPGFQDSPVGLMAHAEAGLTRFEDVPDGKRKVAIEAGSAFQEYLWKKYQWDGKVAMVPTSGALGAFAADPDMVQQGYVTSEPCSAEAQGLRVQFLPGRDAGWNPYASLAIVRSTDATAPWVTAFREATLEGWKHYLADPTSANATISSLNPDMPPARIACVTERQRSFVTGTDGVGAMTAERWTAIAAAMTSAGQPVDAAGAWLPR